MVVFWQFYRTLVQLSDRWDHRCEFSLDIKCAEKCSDQECSECDQAWEENPIKIFSVLYIDYAFNFLLWNNEHSDDTLTLIEVFFIDLTCDYDW